MIPIIPKEMHLSTSSQVSLTRRAFLKTSGAIAGATAAATLLTSCESTPQALQTIEQTVQLQTPVTLGVLLPHLKLNPLVGQQVLDGMRLYSNTSAQRQINLVVHEVGVGQYEAHRAAQELLDQGGIDMLVGVVNPMLISPFHELLQERQTFLLIADVGADVVRSQHENPYVATHSLGYWQANYAMAHQLVRRFGRRAVLVTSFYDSGYDSVYAFRYGFEEAGGQVLETLVTHRPIDDDAHLMGVIEQIKALQPDVVYLVSSGRDAEEFAQAYAAAGVQIPLAGASFSADIHASQVPPISTVMPWARELATDENQAFVSNFEAATGRPADALALLGYETALLIDTALSEAGGDLRDVAAMQQALANMRVTSPRGLLTLDIDNQHTNTPLYTGIARYNGGKVQYESLEELTLPAGSDILSQQLRTSVKSGWCNPYLCF